LLNYHLGRSLHSSLTIGIDSNPIKKSRPPGYIAFQDRNEQTVEKLDRLLPWFKLQEDNYPYKLNLISVMAMLARNI